MKKKKKDMIRKIIDAQVDCIEQWILNNDHDDLRAWLKIWLGLESMTKAELEREWGAYLGEI